MNQFQPKKTRRNGPEQLILDKVRDALTLRGWFIIKLHGSMYQSGLPDLYCTHKTYGMRFVEVKNPLAFSFTVAQKDIFPKLIANGTGVWVLVSDSEEELQKLFKPHNYWHFCLK
jgi:hypothetical protein